MNDEDLKYYNVYGELAADSYILNEMLKLLQDNDKYDFIKECQEAKMYSCEIDNIKRWQWHTNNQPVNEIYRLLGHLQEKYRQEYKIALLSYLKSNSRS